MTQDSQKIELVHTLNPTVFAVMNKDVLGNTTQRLSSTQSAVTRMLTSNSDMLKMLMPTIINTMPNDPQWYKTVANYWHSFGRDVPAGGVALEIGFSFDIGNADRKSYIDELVDKTKDETTKKRTINTSEELRDYVKDSKNKISPNDWYKYATPINVYDYLTWIYALGHREVANNPSDSNRSTNIRFTLLDPRLIEETRRSSYQTSLEATKMYLEILGDKQKVRDVLFVLGENPDAYVNSEIDAHMKLKHISDTAPKKFVAICKDKALAAKGRIERYILSDVLKRLPNSTIVVDSQDGTSVIGNTLDECVIYFMSESPDRMAKVKEFAARYTLIKNNKSKL